MNMARVIDRGTLNVITHSASTLLLKAVLTLHALITELEYHGTCIYNLN